MKEDAIILGLTLLNQFLASARDLGAAIVTSRQSGQKLDLKPFRGRYQTALADLDAEIARAEAEGR